MKLVLHVDYLSPVRQFHPAVGGHDRRASPLVDEDGGGVGVHAVVVQVPAGDDLLGLLVPEAQEAEEGSVDA